MSFVLTDLTCIHCGATFPGANLATAEGTWMTCPKCGPADGVLDVGYDLDRVNGRMARLDRSTSGRGTTGVTRNCCRLSQVRCDTIGRLDTRRSLIRSGWLGSWECINFCSRMKAATRRPRSRIGPARSALRTRLQVGAKTIACASTGNAASSLAGHAALAGMPAMIFVPQTAPEPKVAQLQVFGATVFAVKSSYDAAYDLVLESLPGVWLVQSQLCD